MGLMDQFRPNSQGQRPAGFAEQMGQLRSMLSGDLTPLVQAAAQSGATCQMPDGRRLTLKEFAEEMQGKSPKDAYKSCGYDFDEVMQLLGTK